MLFFCAYFEYENMPYQYEKNLHNLVLPDLNILTEM